MRQQPATVVVDRRVAELAERQHGVVGVAQLRALGLSHSAIASRARKGWLHGVHRGVYAVGHARPSGKGRYLAAVLACGANAALSHGSAADLWDLRGSSASSVHVTVATAAGRELREGIVIHRARGLRGGELTVHDGIPVTTVARTLLDIAGDLAPRRLERAVEQSVILRLFDLDAVNATIARHPNRKGSHTLSTIVANMHDEPPLIRSELEAFFCDLCDANCLPRPQINQVVEGLIVDFLWRRHKLVVETDGRATHGTPAAFEGDRARAASSTRITATSFTVTTGSGRRSCF